MRPFSALALLLRAFATSFILSLLCLCSVAQQQDQAGATPDAPSANHQPDKPQASSPMQGGAQVVSFLARKSIVFPDLATNSGPLSPEQKFKLFVSNGVAPSTIFAAGMSAGINQALNSPAGYGQGGEGYGKRFGAAMARSASSRFFGTFLLASALREDPRFFVRNDLHFGGSVKYSFRRVFITRSDSGDQVINWSGLLGPLAAEGLANIYFPDNYRTAGNTFSRYGRDLGWIARGNLLRQYWPRINRKLKLVPEQTTLTTPSGQPSSKR
jgi:hypothetical protein